MNSTNFFLNTDIFYLKNERMKKISFFFKHYDFLMPEEAISIYNI